MNSEERADGLSALGKAALKLAARGFAVFPCRPRAKEPLISGGFRNASRDGEQIRAWWSKWPEANIGLVPGPKCVVLDIDGENGERTARRLEFADEPTLQVRTARGRHLYFLHPGVTIGNHSPGGGVDVRADAGYVLAPPSIHPTGAKYAWEGNSLLQLPPSVLDKLLALNGHALVAEGGRNNALTSHLGRLRHFGASEDDLLAEAEEFNASCDPPLDDREVRAVVKSILRYPPGAERGDAVIDELNATYAVVQVGTKVRVLQEREDDFVLLPPGEFKLLFANRLVSAGRRSLSAADHWLQHPQRRQFSGIDFVPGRNAPQGIYNVWRGWGVEPSEVGSCERFLAHLREIICAGDEDLFRWVSGWFAQMFQQPTTKLGTSLVLRGAQGTGKTIVGRVFGHLLGSAYRHVASGRMVTGQFNHHLEGCLLLHADEAFWAGDKGSEGVLKDLVTNDYQWIERKGIEAIQTRNYLRLFVTSNSDWVVPAGLEERRFATLDVSTGRMQDKNYFKQMMAELDAGGYGALLQHCLTLELDEVDLRTIPHTLALSEQKLASLKPEEQWYVDLLQRGFLPGDKDGSGLAPTQSLFDDFYAHAQKIGTRHRAIETMIGIFLKRAVPGLERTRVTDSDGNIVACYQFPSLKVCREAFGAAMRGYAQWEEPHEWQATAGSSTDDDAF